ncbi:zinc metallopeptidase [Pseudomonadota bacterium]
MSANHHAVRAHEVINCRALLKKLGVGDNVELDGCATLIEHLLHLGLDPVEWDASFRRALPLLEAGDYLSPDDLRNARQILTAAALTYVAGSLASLLNLWRWLRLLKR